MSDDKIWNPGKNYSLLDRALHRLVFLSPAVQFTAADIDTSLYGARTRSTAVERPIFVTSLPRAGTTLILEILTHFRGLATHSYRDMPFVVAPLLWNALSKSFRKPAELRERAHGDGMRIGYDSPEAFEEILWRLFWPEKYKRDRIELWRVSDDADEFRKFFLTHIQKINNLRGDGDPGQRRYLSKNNANIARIPLLRRLFPNALLVVPFRKPLDQAMSLLNQHERFCELHKVDSFSRRYMDDIGHLEFGELHRPIWFEGMDETCRRYHPDNLNYWIAYWIHAFQHILRFRDEVFFVSYERLCETGQRGIRTFAERLDIPFDQLHGPLPGLRVPRFYKETAEGPAKDFVEETDAIHSVLLSLSIV